jgi:glycosyltransferase involved in cell wall biosynthesis
MKIAIISTRGIPNRYGGFEELAEHLGVHLAKNGHEVTVFNPHHHPNRAQIYKGVHRVFAFDPTFLGAAGQFIYDALSIIKCWKIRPQIVLQLGYTSSAIWFWLMPPKTKIITNMDGLEWQRSKYNRLTKSFLRFSEWLAAKTSHLLVADHLEMQHYLQQKFVSQTVYIPYGAHVPNDFESKQLHQFKVTSKEYYLVVARMEPENNIEMILEGYLKSSQKHPLLVVGNIQNKHGRRWQKKYAHPKIQFIDGVYHKPTLNALRHYAAYYLHGHSVGGTNPALLEAMACGCRIWAHQNTFNQGVLETHAWFFESADELAALFASEWDFELEKRCIKNNLSKVRTAYNWRIIAEQYEIACKQLVLR